MKKIIVYDRGNYFFRFIKVRYSKKYDVLKHVKLSDFNSYCFNNLFLIILVVYDDKEIIPYINFSNNNLNIIVCSDNLEVLEKFKKVGDADFLNTSTLKSVLIERLDFLINYYAEKEK